MKEEKGVGDGVAVVVIGDGGGEKGYTVSVLVPGSDMFTWSVVLFPAAFFASS